MTDEAQVALMAAVVRGGRDRDGDPRRLAWVPWDQLAAAGHAESTRDALIGEGLALVWRGALTLTPAGAAALGVEVRDVGFDEHPGLEGIDRPRPPVVVRRERGHGRRDAPAWMIEKAIDPAPTPSEVLEDEWTGAPLVLFGRVVPRRAS
jgi:hypothetical protein